MLMNRKITFKQYNNALDAIEAAGFPLSDDLREYVAGLDTVDAIIAGDLSGVPVELLKGKPDAKSKIPKGKKPTKEKPKQENTPPAEPVCGDIVGDDFEGVPAPLMDLVKSCIESACIEYKIEDLCKAPAERWRAVCMYTGRHIKQSKLLFDLERLKTHGGTIIYKPERVEALMRLWVELCAAFDKAPMACDFISFSGISSNWFYDNNGNSDLTSSRVQIAKKLNDLQEAGLAVRLADGRRNPTGQIFILKNCHGWRDQREIVHSNDTTQTAAALPVFNLPQLPENQ